MGKRRKSLKRSLCCEGMHFGRKTGCIEKTRASPGSSLVRTYKVNEGVYGLAYYVDPLGLRKCLKPVKKTASRESWCGKEGGKLVLSIHVDIV